jgi:hypothetical protein
MKKSTACLLFAFAALALAAASCEPEENATIIVRNDLGFDVAELSFTGDADTGNVLGGSLPIIPNNADEVQIPSDVAPGSYTWHVKYVAGSAKAGDDGAEEIELWPGLNHLVLTVTLLP